MAELKRSDQKAAGSPRRTQGERSNEMRRRLIAATIASLHEDGYAGVTISGIVDRAGVSRGAHLHHFESKSALIGAAANELMRTIYRRLGQATPGIDGGGDRLASLVHALWDNVFLVREGEVILELLIAARTDADLRGQLSALAPRVREMYAAAARHYFKAKPGAAMTVEEIISLTHRQLTGMLLDAPLHDGPNALRGDLDRWIMLMDRFIAPRRGVTAPPPRPDWWDDVV